MRRSLLAVLSLLVLVLLLLACGTSAAQDEESLFLSPALTGTAQVPPPTATPETSEYARIALNYVVTTYGVPEEQLVIANEHSRSYELSGRSFQAFSILDQASGRWFKLMVDLQDQMVVEDIQAIEQAEDDAHSAEYGKLEPALAERLEEMSPDDTVTVAIWIAGEPQRSEEELYAALAAKYPEAQEGLERSGNPFDVGDYDLNIEIESEYVRLLEEDIQAQLQPLVTLLQQQDLPVTTMGATPAIVVTPSKGALLELMDRPDVGMVYLAEGQETLDTE